MSKNLYSFCPYVFFSNDQILKDCCLIPYSFHKYLNYNATIIAAQKEEYTNLTLVNGLKMDIQKAPLKIEDYVSCKEWHDICINYINREYKNIDILFGFGLYPIFPKLVKTYKSLRPDGKIILKLDINNYWMDTISYENSNILNTLENCDIISCESKRIKKFLSEKWPIKIDYVTNGSIQYFEKESPRWEDKENIILTVGKIGTPAKANHVLLEGFKKAYKSLPGWKLKLVGDIEPDFQKYIGTFLSENPQLKDAIIFTGRINDKAVLNKEYQKAKIFTLTSKVEGFPNVFSEAAQNGCYMVCSNIDAADEFTAFGTCGKKFEIGDSDELAKIFANVCNNNGLIKKAFNEIILFHNRFFDYKRTVHKLDSLLSLGGEVL